MSIVHIVLYVCLFWFAQVSYSDAESQIVDQETAADIQVLGSSEEIPIPLTDLPTTFDEEQVWRGPYTPNRGGPELELTITNVSNGTTSPQFGLLQEISAIATINHGAKSGSYHVSGLYDVVDRKIVFTPGDWIQSLKGYAKVGLDGSVKVEGNRYQGRITGLDKKFRFFVELQTSSESPDADRGVFGQQCDKERRLGGASSANHKGCLADLYYKNQRYKEVKYLLMVLANDKSSSQLHFEFGRRLYKGDGVPQDVETGLAYLVLGGGQGKDASVYVAELALSPSGTDLSLSTRHQFLSYGASMSVDKNNKEMKERKKMFFQEKTWLEFQSKLHGLELHTPRSWKYYAESLRESHPEAYYQLWQRDKKKTQYLYLAAKNGHAKANYLHALLLIENEDYRTASKYLAKAKALGHTDTKEADGRLAAVNEAKLLAERKKNAALLRKKETRKMKEQKEIARLRELNIPEINDAILQKAMHRHLSRHANNRKKGLSAILGFPPKLFYKCDDENCYAMAGVIRFRLDIIEIEECGYDRLDRGHCTFRMRLDFGSTISGNHPGNEWLNAATNGAILTRSGSLRYSDQWNFVGDFAELWQGR